jgi:GDP-4-dehydro-6-deoxy-D-mannose reductase
VVALSSGDADLRDPEAVRTAVRDAAPEVVYHLAGESSVPRSWERPAAAMEVNAGGALNLLEALRSEAPRARTVIVGSGEMYGPPERLPLDEGAPLRPQNPYAVSKAAADLLAGMYAEVHGLHAVRVRAFNHAGPGQSPAFVVGALARQVAAGLVAGDDPIRLVTGSVEPRRDFTDVRDVVRAYRALADAGAATVYNVCSGRSTSVAELIELLRDVAGRELAHEVDADLVRDHEVMEVRGSHERLTAATGWEPEIPLERTLADAIAWWKQELGAPRC